MKKKRFWIFVLSVGLVGVIMASPSPASELLVFDRPLNILGYVTQEVGYGLNDKDYYDTVKGVQTVLSNFFVGFYMNLVFLGKKVIINQL